MLRKIDNKIVQFERILCGYGMLFMTLLVAFGVFSRLLFKYTFSFIEELSQYVMVWVAFLGAILCVPENGHVGIDIITNKLSGKAKEIYLLILNAISCAYLTWFTVINFKYTHTIHVSHQTATSMTWLPRSVLYVSGCVGCLLMAFEYLKITIRVVEKIKKHDYSETEKPVEELEHM